MILSNTLGRKKYSRIISLVPSQTELLFHLGLESEVVGLTKFCIHPEKWFRSKKRVGGTKMLDIPAIHSLNPDLIIANKEENVKEQVEELAENFNVWVTDVNNLDEATRMIEDIGELTGREKEAYLLQSEILHKFVELQKSTSGIKKRRGAYLIWKDPYMVAGGDSFINNMLSYCAIENIFVHELRYPVIDLKNLQKKKCEIILLSSEPYPFKEKHQEEMEKLLPGIEIRLVDGEMFSWYGSRLLPATDYFKLLKEQFAQIK